MKNIFIKSLFQSFLGAIIFTLLGFFMSNEEKLDISSYFQNELYKTLVFFIAMFIVYLISNFYENNKLKK